MTLQPGQWFMYQIDQPIPSRLNVFEGSVETRRKVGEVKRMQALALKRWHGITGLYFSYRDRNGNQRDVRVVGDLEAWMGDK